MAADYQTSLSDLLSTFRTEVTEALAASSQRFRQELRGLQATLEKQFDTQFQSVEKNLSVPLNHSLPWDWLPDPDEYPDLDVFLDTRQLRYRGDPTYVVTATVFYQKYCPPQTDVLKELGQFGFYVPQNSKLFARFGKDAVDRKKKLLHVSQVRRSGVPQDQIDVAWAKEAASGTDDLQEYVPQGLPVTRGEKEFFLDIACTLRGGIKYKVVWPLTDEEQRELDRLRREVGAVSAALASLEGRQSASAALRCDNAQWSVDTADFLAKHKDAQAHLQRLEAGEEDPSG